MSAAVQDVKMYTLDSIYLYYTIQRNQEDLIGINSLLSLFQANLKFLGTKYLSPSQKLTPVQEKVLPQCVREAERNRAVFGPHPLGKERASTPLRH